MIAGRYPKNQQMKNLFRFITFVAQPSPSLRHLVQNCLLLFAYAISNPLHIEQEALDQNTS